MAARLNDFQTSPKAMAPLAELEKYLHTTSLDPRLLELMKLRASQINGWACNRLARGDVL